MQGHTPATPRNWGGAARRAQPFLRTPFNETAPQFSPDGRWLAYISDESGRDEIYVQPYPGPGGKWEISTEGGTEPVWNPNGQELFYRSGDKMMAVDVTTQLGFAAGKPRMLFEGPYMPSEVTFPNMVVHEAHQRGVTHVIVTHAMAASVRMTIPQMQAAAHDGALIEFVYPHVEAKARL
jgi:hypothetical protein